MKSAPHFHKNALFQLREPQLSRRHSKHLGYIVSNFCAFLRRRPKPSADLVREHFLKAEYEWKTYCIMQGLGIRAAMMFNAKVSYIWEKEFKKKA